MVVLVEEVRTRHFRTGNAADQFREVDRYVSWRLKRMRIKRKGRHLKAGEARRWTECVSRDHR